ncbi:MAG: DivIVA domain-containing protein [Oscillospiraceae bacterium]|nr:DivIVA domain-containing protein [Oscillospiraceae bacterium]
MAKTFFKEKENGYDKEQVDRYIDRLIKTYQSTYAAYLDVSERYHLLEKAEKNKNLGGRLYDGDSFQQAEKRLRYSPGG